MDPSYTHNYYTTHTCPTHTYNHLTPHTHNHTHLMPQPLLLAQGVHRDRQYRFPARGCGSHCGPAGEHLPRQPVSSASQELQPFLSCPPQCFCLLPFFSTLHHHHLVHCCQYLYNNPLLTSKKISNSTSTTPLSQQQHFHINNIFKKTLHNNNKSKTTTPCRSCVARSYRVG